MAALDEEEFFLVIDGPICSHDHFGGPYVLEKSVSVVNDIESHARLLNELTCSLRFVIFLCTWAQACGFPSYFCSSFP